MNCLSLNCRGLGNPDAVGGLRNLIRRKAPALVFLCETKLSSSEMRRITSSLEGYCSMEVDSVGRSGGLAFLWRKEFRDIYLSWQLLRYLVEEDHSAWLCIGDFNEILYANEMKGGSRAQWQMNNFREAVDKGLSIGKILRDLNRKRKRLAWLNVNERTVDNVRERKNILGDMTQLLRQEELFWRQRSRALWLKDGDRKTKYFHKKARQRKRKNYISRVVDGRGVVREGGDAIREAAVDYVSTLFGSSRPSQVSELFDGVRGRVSEYMNVHFRAEYRSEEVVEALAQMHPLKAPGPDGMNALFYQTY
ncbi:uncharacterized protein LOC141590643 [Silene latifolia]|uniref:uncharacterized protein LOC141590643 n=1 Tax=Silene latifolia TaxID=37657 RepID=UPI003D76E7C2